MTMPPLASLTGTRTTAQDEEERKRKGLAAQATQQAQAQNPQAAQAAPGSVPPAPHADVAKPAAPGAAPAPVQTFAQMQAAGQARPAPPPPPPAPVAPAAPAAPNVADATKTALLQSLGNPSAYGTPEVQQTYDRLGGQIDDQYALQGQNINEELARRGLSASTEYGGRMKDLNVTRRSAKVDLADRLAQEQAQGYAAARSAAIGQGQTQTAQEAAQAAEKQRMALDAELGRGGLDVSRGNLALNTRSTDAGIANQTARLGLDTKLGEGQLHNQGEDLALRRTTADRDYENAVKAREQQGSQYDRGLALNKDELAQRGSQFDKNYGLDQQRFGEGQRQYDNSYQLDLLRSLGFDTTNYGDVADPNADPSLPQVQPNHPTLNADVPQGDPNVEYDAQGNPIPRGNIAGRSRLFNGGMVY